MTLGKIDGNTLQYDASEGTLGLYSPAGAGFIADTDGSLYAGDTDGAHMRWDNASRAFQVRNAEDVKISLDANGDGFFDGTVYAQGGRIYGTMAVDGLLRVGDVDGPQVAMGRFERINNSGDLVETGEILATDASNLPWFHVVAGGETAGGGYFHLGATGEYAGRMTFDGVTLSVANWIVDSEGLVSPSGYIQLDTIDGLRFISPVDEPATEGMGGEVYEDHMISVWLNETDAQPTHRISAWQSSSSPPEHTLFLQAEPPAGQRARILHSALGTAQADLRFRAVGAYNTPNQQVTQVDLWAYREEGGGAFTHRRIDMDTDLLYLKPYTAATAPGGTIQDGCMLHTEEYDPGGGDGFYVRAGGYFRAVALDADGWQSLTVADDGITLGNVKFYTCSDAGGSFTINLPAATAKTREWEYILLKSNSSANTITVSGTINGATSYALTNQYQCIIIRRAGAAYNIISEVNA
jgi:hypothetical protein